jgi:hypothetical protein
MTHNAGFKSDDDNWNYYPPNEIWETRQVMLAQGKKLDALEGLVKFQQGQIKDLLDYTVDLSKAVLYQDEALKAAGIVK